MGEFSMGRSGKAAMQRDMVKEQATCAFRSADHARGYLNAFTRRAIAPNVASFVGAGTVREAVLGADDVQPTPGAADRDARLVRAAMEKALGRLMLIYTPATFCQDARADRAGQGVGGVRRIYTVHIAQRGRPAGGGVAETIAIAGASGAPAEILPFQTGRALHQQDRLGTRHDRGGARAWRAWEFR